MRKIILSVLALSLISVLSSCCGCKGAKSKNPHFLTSDKWSLVEMNGKVVADEHREPESYTLTFDAKESKIYGVAGCNNFFSTYKENDTRKLTVNDIGSTRKMCPNQTLENEFLSTIKKADSYTIDLDMLMLQKDGEVIAIFQAKPLNKIEK